MAFSAHKTKEEMQEHFDTPEVLENKARQVASLILKSNHFIAFTGAGISTSCGIPDFRGPNGVWTLRAEGKTVKGGTSSIKAIPSLSHMALVQLVNNGNLKCVVSQNTDGLHRKSGLTKDQVCELHGNTNKEVCAKCHREYLRDGKVRTNTKVHEHETGNKCDDPSCRGPLKDTIINFGENLNEDVLNKGFEEGAQADLCLALGSSLTVSPANDIPASVAKKGKLVIVNLQKTPLDHKAAIRVFGKIDDFMIRVMNYLQLPIPEWRLRRHVDFIPSTKGALKLYDVDEHSGPYTFIKSASVKESIGMRRDKDSAFSVPVNSDVTIEFKGFYNEPPLKLKAKDGKLILLFNPRRREWEVVPVPEFPTSPYFSEELSALFGEVQKGKPAASAGPELTVVD